MQDMNRFRVYELLFSKPLYACAKKTKDGFCNDVLILGSGVVGTEAIKAIYWCGQYDVTNRLNITVASATAREYEAKLAAQMPGMAMFPEFANIQCVQIPDLRVAGALEELDFAGRNYDYIIIALGDNATNYCVAEAVKQRIVSTPDIGGKTIISIFDEEGDAPFSEQKIPAFSNHKELIVCSFGNGMATQAEYQKQQALLKRIAFNIDFSYSMEQNQRVSRAEVLARFERDPYYSESSYACAVHIPYKLAMCNGFRSEDAQNMDALMEAIAAKNDLFYRLTAVEHRRWVAYMVVCGYTPPTPEQLDAYAFVYPNDHRNMKDKLHPCMCACQLTPCRLSEHHELWEADESQWAELSDLDRMSILLHQTATKRAEPICANAREYFAFVANVKHSDALQHYENLKLSVLKLCNGEENSILLYRQALKEAWKAALDAADEAAREQVAKIERDFRIVVRRNHRADYHANDAALINRLPFCLWYGEMHKTVITFTKGVLCEDVILPTLLCAEKAIFIGDFEDEKHYKALACRYFSHRGGNTEVVTHRFRHNGVADIAERLTELVNQNEAVIINCVDCKDPQVFIAIGTVAAERKIPVVHYHAERGIVPILNESPIGPMVGDKSLTVEEFTSLMGGVYRNVYANVSNIDDYENFTKLFWKYSKEHTYQSIGKNGQSKTTVCSPWSTLTTFFQSATKDETPNFAASPVVAPRRYEGSFEARIFKKCNLGPFLDALNTFQIIKNLTTVQDEEVVTVQFVYVDLLLEQLLTPFECQQTADHYHRQECLGKRLKFSSIHGVSITNTRAANAVLMETSEHEKLKADKLKFVNELQEYGLIQSVQYSEDLTRLSFAFKDEKIQHLFKTQGRLYELILYRGFRNSGLFDDVQTGVQISWEAVGKSLETLLRERLARKKGLGYAHYKAQVEYLREEMYKGRLSLTTENELDVVVMQGMQPVFISCKTGKKGYNEWLNEIATLSNHFHAQPVLAVMKNLDAATTEAFVARARKIGVSLIGTETISDSERFACAIREIAAGRRVFGPDTRTKKR